MEITILFTHYPILIKWLFNCKETSQCLLFKAQILCDYQNNLANYRRSPAFSNTHVTGKVTVLLCSGQVGAVSAFFQDKLRRSKVWSLFHVVVVHGNCKHVVQRGVDVSEGGYHQAKRRIWKRAETWGLTISALLYILKTKNALETPTSLEDSGKQLKWMIAEWSLWTWRDAVKE